MAPSTAPATMATPSGSGPASPAARRPSAAKPTGRRRIEPVIPLTFLQRRQNAPAASTQLPPSPLRTSQNTPPTPKQNSQDRHQPTPQPTPQPESEPECEPEPEPQQTQVVADGTLLEDNASDSPQKPEQEEVGVTTVETALPPHEKPQPDTASPQTQGIASPSQTSGKITPPDTAPSAPSPASFPPPVSSPSPPNSTEPSFYPSNNHPAHPQGPIPGPMNLPTHPLDHPSRMHQPHPSNDSLVFGGLEGSNTTSPLPHPGGAFLPPPPISMAPEHIPVNGVGAHGRPVLAPAPIDVHAPMMMMNHGPLTPHSLHGSHSSRTEDFGPKVLPVNGANGTGVGRPVLPPAPGRHSYHPSNQAAFSPGGFDGAAGDVMAFSDFISSMFARPEFADCEVVLALPDRLTPINSRFPGAHSGPLRLPGHRLVLSQHHLLRSIIQEQARLGDGPCEVRIESDDPFLRADAMWRAIKHLYGCRYVPLPHHLEAQSDAEKFHFALGYAAAGAHLQVPAVSISAVQEASKLLSWDTVEKGLEFSLTGLQAQRAMHVPHNFPTFGFKHGVYVGEFVEKIVLFLITCFPANFALDTTVGDPNYSRLPSVSATPRDPSQAAPGSSVTNGSHSASRMSNINIKFGDMDLTEANGHNKPQPSQPQSDQIQSALSRILLNLPFEVLRLVLETNSVGERNLGWQTAQERRLIMPEVIAERESRRLRFAGELMAGSFQGPVPMDRLRSKIAQPMELSWGNVCWKEECVPYAPDVFSMDRRWVPIDTAF